MKTRTPRAHTRRIAPGLYTARSHRPGHPHHYVGVKGPVVTCSCEAYTLGNGKTCHAMLAVMRRLLRRPAELMEVASR